MTRKQLLILTYYFPPDLCAGSFRAGAFVDALMKRGAPGIDIEVLTTMPNRYQSFSSDALPAERQGNLSIRRFPVTAHKSGFLDQSLAFRDFGQQVLRHVRGSSPDLVFATSSRLFTATLGAFLANRRNVPLYLDMRDIFTETMDDVLRAPLRQTALPIFKALEAYTMRSADIINLVSPGFEPHFSSYTEKSDLRFFTNGIDSEFLDREFAAPCSGSRRKVILVAGNIGEGQGLHKIIPKAADLLAESFEIKVIGDGGMKRKLQEACAGKENVTLLPPVNRAELMRQYTDADVLFMHLNDYDAFKKVLPSKVFEYAATGKPVLAGVSGFAAEFTRSEVDNSAVFPPCDADAMIAKLSKLDLHIRDRKAFKAKYARSEIMSDMADDVLRLLH